MMRAVQRGPERISEADRTVGAKYFGASVPRREDPRFLRGEGRFVDDIEAAGHAARRVRPQPARPRAHHRRPHRRGAAVPGVARVFTFADLARCHEAAAAVRRRPAGAGRARRVTMRQAPQFALCRGRGAATWARSWPWWWPTAARSPRTPPSWSRSTRSPLGVVTDVVAAARAGRARSSTLGSDNIARRVSRRLRRRRARAFAEADAGCASGSHPALRRHADRDAGRGRAVGPARPERSPPGTAPRSSTSSSRGSWPRSGCPPTRSG